MCACHLQQRISAPENRANPTELVTFASGQLFLLAYWGSRSHKRGVSATLSCTTELIDLAGMPVVSHLVCLDARLTHTSSPLVGIIIGQMATD